MNVSNSKKYSKPTRQLGSLWWLLVGAVLGYLAEHLADAVRPYGKALAWIAAMLFSLYCWKLLFDLGMWATGK